MRIRIKTSTCNHYLDEPCLWCDADLKKPIQSPRFHPFRAGFYEHVSHEGKYCETADDLRKACEENGSYSMYLENSLHGGSIGKIKEI